MKLIVRENGQKLAREKVISHPDSPSILINLFQGINSHLRKVPNLNEKCIGKVDFCRECDVILVFLIIGKWVKK